MKMKKTDFSKMTRKELRLYVLAHREDDEAIEALIDRGSSHSTTYPCPRTEEDLTEMQEILKRKLDSMDAA